ncbi:multiple sugar transport system substrate-binding protein [Catenulispora sp. MAP5-51]|uniref:extracellular solute-binding protein n=1 Tax=Catenulispora sp. MAP5-51 TaxID=3156298 RepID=UPI0035177880
MKHTSSTRRAAVAGSAALILFTAACGASSSGSGGKSGPGATGACGSPASNSDDSPITGAVTGKITFVTSGLKSDFADFFNAEIKKFTDAHPGTSVDWQDLPADSTDARLVTDASSCTLADVINIATSDIKALSDAGTLMTLDKKVPGVADQFVPSVWTTTGFGKGGTHTAFPWYWGPSVLTYNKKIFTAAGLDPAKPPATMADYFADAAQIKAKTGDASIWGNPTWILPDQWYGMGVQAMNADNTQFTFADDPNAKAWMQGYVDAYKSGAIPKDSITGAPDPSQGFSNGDLAFGSTNASFLRSVQKNAPQLYPDTAVAPFPKTDPSKTLLNAQFVAVNKNTKNPAAAVAFAQFITSPDEQLAWCKDPKVVIFPTTTKSLQDPYFSAPADGDPFSTARAVAAKEAQTAQAWVPALYLGNTDIGKAIVQQLQLAMQGQVSVDAALKAAQDKANTIMASLNH